MKSLIIIIIILISGPSAASYNNVITPEFIPELIKERMERVEAPKQEEKVTPKEDKEVVEAPKHKENNEAPKKEETVVEAPKEKEKETPKKEKETTEQAPKQEETPKEEQKPVEVKPKEETETPKPEEKQIDEAPIQEEKETVEEAPKQPEQEQKAEPTIESHQFEIEVTNLVNVERQKQGLAPLTHDSNLSNVARDKSKDMASNGYFSHDSPTYGSPFDMMRSYGINYRAAGENIAAGQRTPQAVVRDWMNSSGHRANILSRDFTHIGVGYAEGGRMGVYWTQMFISK
jgi:uncharacterized YkwD family protein